MTAADGGSLRDEVLAALGGSPEDVQDMTYQRGQRVAALDTAAAERLIAARRAEIEQEVDLTRPPPSAVETARALGGCPFCGKEHPLDQPDPDMVCRCGFFWEGQE